MESYLEKLRTEIESLRKDGYLLLCGLTNEMRIPYSEKELKGVPEDMVKRIKRASFKSQYQKWYNASLALIKQLLPDRVIDFTSIYHSGVKKDKDLVNFGIEDYILGLTLTAYSKEENYSIIRSKFDLQLQMVCSLSDRLDSSLFEMRQLLEADLFDSEIEAAATLAKRGFLRGAGAVCGVVLEKHLKSVMKSHSLSLSKKTPTINDLNELLKNNNVIDVAQWRLIQYLGDLRNLCDHDKDKEPTNENLDDLISGVKKVLKTVY